MYNDWYVGSNVSAFSVTATKHIGKLLIEISDESSTLVDLGVSGDTLHIKCPYLDVETEEGLAAIRHVYGPMVQPGLRAFSAVNAKIDPAMSLGDGLSVCGHFVYIGDISFEANPNMYGDLSAAFNPEEAVQDYTFE